MYAKADIKLLETLDDAPDRHLYFSKIHPYKHSMMMKPYNFKRRFWNKTETINIKKLLLSNKWTQIILHRWPQAINRNQSVKNFLSGLFQLVKYENPLPGLSAIENWNDFQSSSFYVPSIIIYKFIDNRLCGFYLAIKYS